MAAVSAAMLRPPGGGLDPPYFSPQMMNYSPTEDKSKKSWGHRMKMNPGVGNGGAGPPGHGYGTISGPGGSSLSKSMKYAETWLYGTVRAQAAPVRPGIYLQYAEPAAPVLISASQNPVQNYAVVVCSCSEYLNGTKKGSTKKVSICKKCKGSRLPLGVPMNGTLRTQPVGGTVRGTQSPRTSGGTLRAGTVKLTPTSKSRPTILSLTPQSQSSDPYDLMRRTRLSTAQESSHVGSQFTVSRSRAKSISPTRNRGRRRSPSADSKTRSKSVSRSKDLWYEDIQSIDGDIGNRRSILECDVNPYDLMQKMKMENLKSVKNDEDDAFADFENDETFTLKKLKQNLSTRQSKKGAKHNGPYSSVQAISGQRIRVFGQSMNSSGKEDFVYDDVEVNNLDSHSDDSRTSVQINGHEISSNVNNYNNQQKRNVTEVQNNASPKNTNSMPRRPPRRSKAETSEEESESDRKESKQKTVTKQLAVNNTFVANRSLGSDSAIKSILKKPRADRPVPAAEPPRPPSPDKKISGSHFYLPTPPANRSPNTIRNVVLQRKKVQFLVENEIVSSSEQDLIIETGALQNDNATSPRRESSNSASFFDNADVNHVTMNDANRNTNSISDNLCYNLVNSSFQNDINHRDSKGYTYFGTLPESESSDIIKVGVNSIESRTVGGDIEIKIVSQDNTCTQYPSNINDGSKIVIEDYEEDNVVSGKGAILRRSQSERLTLQGSPEPPSFLDTMALRPRPPRAHSRQAFVSTQSLVEIINVDKPSRPKDRPPPPPTPPSDSDSSQKLNSSTITIVCQDERKNRVQTETIIPIKHSNSYSNLRPNNEKENIVNRRHTTDGNQTLINAEIQRRKISLNSDVLLPAAPPRFKVKETNHESVISHKKEPNYVKTRFVRDKHILEEVSAMIAFDADDKASVQISTETPSQQFPSTGIHKISITQNDEFEDDSKKIEDANRKTSIMINGDDCYSTVNVNNDTPLYQSSVTINDAASPNVTSLGNTVTISVYSKNDKSSSVMSSLHNNQIYINNQSSYKSNNDNESHSSKIMDSINEQTNSTYVVVDYETINNENTNIDSNVNKVAEQESECTSKDNQFDDGNYQDIIRDDSLKSKSSTSRGTRCHENTSTINSVSEELTMLLRDPVEAVKRNLVPHVCGKAINDDADILIDSNENNIPIKSESEIKSLSKHSFVARLLEDPMLGHLAEGLDNDLVAKLIENSLLRLKQSRTTTEIKENEDDETMSRLIDVSLMKLQEEKADKSSKVDPYEKVEILRVSENNDLVQTKGKEPDKTVEITNDENEDVKCSKTNSTGNNICSPPYESMEYESGLNGTTSDAEPLSDCYNASASELSTEEDNCTRNKFYQMLVDATLSEIEISNNLDDDHHYESIRLNADPIYEEIGDIPPPLPLYPPPSSLSMMDEDRKHSTRSIFEGASKYDILSYLVDAKERGIVPEDSYTFNFNSNNELGLEEDGDGENNKETIDHQRQSSDLSSRVSNLSNGSDSSEDNSLIITNLGNNKSPVCKKSSAEIERNDSGVGSETSKCSRSRWQGHSIPPSSIIDTNAPLHLCEDCDGAVETQVTESGVMFAPLVCRKCGKKRAERKEIITEIVETEEKYGRDLQIILEEFYQPMLVAGLLTQEQLSAIFLNVEELLENNQALAERLRDALEIAVEQGDEDLLTVNIGKLMLESAPMLHAFSSYCVRQGSASMLLSSLEKEKELLRIFLKVSQMENTVLRRMNLNSFLMVPVQRVTKYPLLLSRLYKVTPPHLDGRDLLRQSQQKIEQHLARMNSEAKDVTSLKLWRRISSGASGRRSSSEIDMINIKLRKMAVDVLEWNHDEARFALEGKLLFTQPNDNNWRKGRTIKLTPINALLVTNGKPTPAYKPCEGRGPCFPHNTGIREASLLLIREKGGRAALLRDPLFLDRCVVAADSDWDDYFELQEIVSKDTYIFKAEEGSRTKQWCQQLQYHSQGMGAWRKRRNALANIMINGMMTRN